MRVGNSKFEIRNSKQIRILMVAIFFLTLPLYSATNISAGDELPRLRPPHGEIPPTFWEKNGIWVILGSIVGLALLAVIIWLVTRPKPPTTVPPEIRAKQALDMLSTKPEDGLVLSQVSQVLRHYVSEAFALPPGELTTAEFCCVIVSHDSIGSELAGTISDFLRRCDERKFTPSPPAAPMGAAATALKLIETAQGRLTEIRVPSGGASVPASRANEISVKSSSARGDARPTDSMKDQRQQE